MLRSNQSYYRRKRQQQRDGTGPLIPNSSGRSGNNGSSTCILCYPWTTLPAHWFLVLLLLERVIDQSMVAWGLTVAKNNSNKINRNPKIWNNYDVVRKNMDQNPAIIQNRRQFWKQAVQSTLFTVCGGTVCISQSLLPAFAATATAISTSNSKAYENIVSRFDSDILKKPGLSSISDLNGIDNTFFPSYLEGTWDVTQTLINVKTPLGLKYVGGPAGSIEVATKSIQEAQSKLNQSVQLKLRYMKSIGGNVVEDRLYNTRERLNNFAGRNVVANIDYADTAGSNRAAILSAGGTIQDPLTTTLVRFKGPAIQKTFVTGHNGAYQNVFDINAEEKDTADTTDKPWVGYEMQRSLFALTNESTAPPITTDTEYIFWFQPISSTSIEAKLRIIGYLNPNDLLYFDANNRAVIIQDYILQYNKKSSRDE